MLPLFKTFYFRIIAAAQEVVKIVQKFPVPFTQFPQWQLLHSSDIVTKPRNGPCYPPQTLSPCAHLHQSDCPRVTTSLPLHCKFG